jgi:hypothetical protein
MITHPSHSKQAQIPSGTTPEAPKPTDATPGTTSSDLALVPPCPPGPAPSAFRVLCPHCGAEVVFPFDPVLSARLDRLQCLEERIEELEHAGNGVLP